MVARSIALRLEINDVAFQDVSRKHKEPTPILMVAIQDWKGDSWIVVTAMLYNAVHMVNTTTIPSLQQLRRISVLPKTCN